MGEPGFWDDQAKAAQVSSEHSRLTRRLERYDTLVREYDDALLRFSLEGKPDAPNTFLYGYVIAYGDQRERAAELVAAGNSAVS